MISKKIILNVKYNTGSTIISSNNSSLMFRMMIVLNEKYYSITSSSTNNGVSSIIVDGEVPVSEIIMEQFNPDAIEIVYE